MRLITVILLPAIVLAGCAAEFSGRPGVLRRPRIDGTLERGTTVCKQPATWFVSERFTHDLRR